MKNYKFLFFILVIIYGAGCASGTLITSDPPGAKIYVNNEYKGVTPYYHEDTEIVFSTVSIVMIKDGYKDYHATITRNESLMILPAVAGVFFVYAPVPWLWALGYKPEHRYTLEYSF